MKRILLFIMIIANYWNAYALTEIEIKAPIKRVVVYEKDCEITRSFSRTYDKGEYQIKFTSLPSSINDNSVRAYGEGFAEVKIQSIKIESVCQDTANERYTVLEDSIEQYREQIIIYDDRLNLLKKEADYLERIKNASTETNKGIGTGIQDKTLNEWKGLISFYESRFQSINDEIIRIDKVKKKTLEKLTAIQMRFQKISSTNDVIQKDVTVNIQVLKEGALGLNISYLLEGAYWQPTYDIRVSPEDKSVEMSYFGIIHQETGEDWSNVKILLSTARPDISGNSPQLPIWYLDIPEKTDIERPAKYSKRNQVTILQNSSKSEKCSIKGILVDAETNEPLPGAVIQLLGSELGANTDLDGIFVIKNVPSGNYSVQARMLGYQPVTITNVSLKNGQFAKINFALLPTLLEVKGIVVTAQRQMVIPDATSTSKVAIPSEVRATNEISDVEFTGTSYVYQTPGENKIPSDGEPHKIPIAFETLKADFEYSSAPRLKQYAYLKGKVKNTTEYPFIAGDINVFFGNNFVGTSAINTVIPSEKFDVSLGIDEGIKITRQKVKDLVENGKRIKRTYGYKITVKNLKKTKEILTVNEQYPVTRNDKIKVKLVSPKFDDEKLEYGIKEKPNGIIEWKMELGPQEKKELELEYILEYPSGVSVTGL